jgi:hypothetical protein
MAERPGPRRRNPFPTQSGHAVTTEGAAAP